MLRKCPSWGMIANFLPPRTFALTRCDENLSRTMKTGGVGNLRLFAIGIAVILNSEHFLGGLS
jgi:hypothetical protein